MQQAAHVGFQQCDRVSEARNALGVGTLVWSSTIRIGSFASRLAPDDLVEVRRARAVDPARAQDQVAAAARSDGALALELAAGVMADRVRRVRPPHTACASRRRTRSRWSSAPAARRARFASSPRTPGATAFTCIASVALGFGLVDRGVRRRIDDHVGPRLAHRLRRIASGSARFERRGDRSRSPRRARAARARAPSRPGHCGR